MSCAAMHAAPRTAAVEVVAFDRIDAIDASQWNALCGDALEDQAYHRVIERSGLPGFRFVHFGAYEDGRLRAVVPGFYTDYRLDTTVQGGLKRITDKVARLLPRLLRIPMLALGSPLTERCQLGFDADCTGQDRARLLTAILDHMETLAVRDKLGMLAIKDAPAAQDALWRQVCPTFGLRPLGGLPGAALALPYADVEEYLHALGAATRKDLRRKRRTAAALRIEWRRDLDGIRDELLRLYRATREHSELQFEELTPTYFDRVMNDLAGRAWCVTYREGAKLVAFNLLLENDARLLDKFLGMDYAAARRLNLYYVSWLENVRHCIAHRIPVYESGQGLHHEKARLGSTLAANALWYKHRNRFVDSVFARLERLAELDDAGRSA